MKIRQTLFIIAITSFIISTTYAQQHKYDTWDENFTAQGLLGAVKYEDLKFDVITDTVNIDLSVIPQLGGAWTTLPRDNRFQYGLEASFLLGFQFDKVNYAVIGGSGAYVSISTSMWMFDLAGGGYANLWLTDNLRLYGGAGPLLMYADYKSEQTYTDTTPDGTERETAFGLGLYTRTGFEFRAHDRGYFGLGARWNWAGLDFSEVGGSSNISGVAVFATYTAGF